jgi:hypothetical protein
MRKMLWGGAAVAVMALMAAGWAISYAADNPTCWLSRCLAAARLVAAPEVHTARATRHTTQVVLRAEGLPGNSDAGAPEDERDPCIRQETPGAEEGCPMEPAVLPGSIAMHEEDAPPAQPMPPVHDVVGALPFLGVIDDVDDVKMPAAEDDLPKMPRVPGDDDHRRPTTGAKDGGQGKAQPAVMPGCDDVPPRTGPAGTPNTAGDRPSRTPKSTK